MIAIFLFLLPASLVYVPSIMSWCQSENNISLLARRKTFYIASTCALLRRFSWFICNGGKINFIWGCLLFTSMKFNDINESFQLSILTFQRIFIQKINQFFGLVVSINIISYTVDPPMSSWVNYIPLCLIFAIKH